MKQAKPATKSLNLPKPIAAYFAADRGDGEAVSQCFTDNAVVKDEGHTHRGRAAIRAWKEDASAKYEYTCEPIACEEKKERRSSRAIWWEIFPAVRLTFDSFSNSMGARLRRWKSSHNNARSRWISASRPKTTRSTG